VRREDTSRKEARERKKVRKAEALAKQNEEVKRLKALKMREIRQQLNTVSKESGLTAEGTGYFPSD
jgi:protein KRI1